MKPSRRRRSSHWRLLCLNLATVCVYLLRATSSRAEEPNTGSSAPYPLLFRLPLIDMPFQAKASPENPSMQQSLALTQDYYYAGHGLIAEAYGTRGKSMTSWSEILTQGAFDILSGYSPLGLSWLHEEWHRAVLGQYGIKSHNGVYHFAGGSSIPVDHVKDEDLAWLKREHPADFVRLATAGMEAESELALAIERDAFLYGILPRQQLLLLQAHLGPLSYRSYCDSQEADRETDRLNAQEGDSIKKRDFTGFDCVAYVYDLFRPKEPYENRGQHPSGVGYNRYRKRSDLTQEERRYLTHMASLGWLNLVDPFIFGARAWQLDDRTLMTGNLRHHLTPFGHSFEQNIFVESGTAHRLIIARQYFNRKSWQPGIEWQELAYPVDIFHRLFWAHTRIGLWMQPKDLSFLTRSWRPGGFIAHELSYALDSIWSINTQIMAKSQGWLAGEPELGSGLSLRLGFEAAWE